MIDQGERIERGARHPLSGTDAEYSFGGGDWVDAFTAVAVGRFDRDDNETQHRAELRESLTGLDIRAIERASRWPRRGRIPKWFSNWIGSDACTTTRTTTETAGATAICGEW
jgi:hypothetical protein